MENYKKVQVIGKGSFAHALLVQSVQDRKHYVMKVIDVSRMDRKQKEEALNEVHVLKAMRHPYIVTYRESFMDKRCLCIVMDYADGGDLYRRIAKQKKLGYGFPEAQILDWFVQMCLALKHIHSRNIMHRDIKTQNIFLTRNGDIKIGDFGIACVLRNATDVAQTAIGTPYYLSPEICQEKPYNQASDIWSLGCILYEMITLRHAFDANSMKRLVMKILRGTYAPLPGIYSDNLRELIAEMLQREPADRPSVAQILDKDFLKERITHVITQTVAKYELARQQQKQGQVPEPEQPEFLTVEGTPLPGLTAEDSLFDRIEALRLYLEEQLGIEAFIRVYEHLKDPPEDDAAFAQLLPKDKLRFVPLVYQLIASEDQGFNE